MHNKISMDKKKQINKVKERDVVSTHDAISLTDESEDTGCTVLISPLLNILKIVLNKTKPFFLKK